MRLLVIALAAIGAAAGAAALAFVAAVWRIGRDLDVTPTMIEDLRFQQAAEQMASKDPERTTYQQDLAAARGWAFGRALEIVRESINVTEPDDEELWGMPTYPVDTGYHPPALGTYSLLV